MPGESSSTPRDIQRYLGRISGPLLDRIDLHVEVPAVKFREITSERTGETSAQIRERVIAARQRQQERFQHKPRVTCNARMGSRELKQYCPLDEATLDGEVVLGAAGFRPSPPRARASVLSPWGRSPGRPAFLRLR
jgi:magnesium chelatase family protein